MDTDREYTLPELGLSIAYSLRRIGDTLDKIERRGRQDARRHGELLDTISMLHLRLCLRQHVGDEQPVETDA